MQGFQDYMLNKIKLASKSVVGRGEEERFLQAMRSKEWASAWGIAAKMAKNNPRALRAAIKSMPEACDVRALRPVLTETLSNGKEKMSPAMMIIAMVLDGEERALSLFLRKSSDVISRNEAPDGLKMALSLGYDKLALAISISSTEITNESFNQPFDNLLERVAAKESGKEGRGLAWALSFATKQNNDSAGMMLLQAGAQGSENGWAPITGSHGEPLLISMIGYRKGMERTAASLIDRMASSGGKGKIELLQREQNGKTALSEAIRVENEWLGQKLAELARGEELMANGRSPLMMALERGSPTSLKIASTIMFNVVQRARRGGSMPRLPGDALIDSAEDCHQSVLAKVIGAGAALSGAKAVELLHFGIDNGHRELVSAIIERSTRDQSLTDKLGEGFIFESLGANGFGALANASCPKNHSYSLEIMDKLLAAGASGSMAEKQLRAWEASLSDDPSQRVLADKAIERLYDAVGQARRTAGLVKGKGQAGSPVEIELMKERLQARAATSRKKIAEALRSANPSTRK